jgi:Ulp1 family protease
MLHAGYYYLIDVHACLILLLLLYNLLFSTVRIWRKEKHWEGCPVHFLSTHFYTLLSDQGGPEVVLRWTTEEKIDVFTKKFLIIPVHRRSHWSLCVVINPGAILNNNNTLKEMNEAPADEELYPCILFFDSLNSLNLHPKQLVASNIRNWLNSEWKRLGKTKSAEHVDPFNENSLQIYAPKGE